MTAYLLEHLQVLHSAASEPFTSLWGSLRQQSDEVDCVHPISTSDGKPNLPDARTSCFLLFDIEVDADSCFQELLLAVATVDVACRCCTLAIGAGNGMYNAHHVQLLAELS